MAACAKRLFLYCSGAKSRTRWNSPTWWSTTSNSVSFLSIRVQVYAANIIALAQHLACLNSKLAGGATDTDCRNCNGEESVQKFHGREAALGGRCC
jgi:hypothetical protein